MKRLFLAAVATLGLITAAGTTTAFAYDGYDRHIDILNRSDLTIMQLQASNVGTSFWKNDILGEDVIGPNEIVNANIDDGTGYCLFDFRAVFDDG